jgi:hypothetical protein
MVAPSSSASTSIVVLFAVALAASFMCSNGAHALTTAQQDAVLKAHNDFRALKGLSALTYNLDAETFAQGAALLTCPSSSRWTSFYKMRSLSQRPVIGMLTWRFVTRSFYIACGQTT